MGKSAPPPTGYVSPQDQQRAGQPINYTGPGADQLNPRANAQQPGVFQQAAEAQASANRPTQYTPFGSSSWTRDPATGAWTQNTSLDPGMQGALSGMQGQLSSAWGSPLDNGAQARTSAENAIYGRETSRLDPAFAMREQQMNAGLANAGLDPGSQAAMATRDQFGRDRNDAYQQATYGAITGGGAEAQRQQQMDLTSRMAPLSAMQQLHGLLAMPGFQPGPSYLQAAMAASNYNLQSTEQQNQMMADYWRGLAGIGAGAMAL